MEEMLQELYGKIAEYYSNRDFDGLEKYLIVKLRENAQTCIACYNPFEVTILNELGTLYRGLGRQKEAVEMFDSAASIIEQRNGSENEEYATAINNLAGAYRLDGQTAEAIRCFQKALDIYERCGSRRSYLFSSAENNLGLVYLGMKDTKRAEACFLDALGIIRELREKNAEYAADLAVTYTNLASVYYYEQDPEKAINFCNKALTEYDVIPEQRQSHRGAVYNLLGDICRNQGKTEKAKNHYQTALAWTEKYFGRNYEYRRLQEKIDCL